MQREKKSPNVASLCAILSSTDLIVLPTLCRARSEADIARRLRPPSPTARESSLASASISCSACSARSTFPAPSLLPVPRAAQKAAAGRRPWLARRAPRPHHPDCRYGSPPFRVPHPLEASPARTDRLRYHRAGLRFLPPDRAHGIRPRDDATGGRGTRA